MLKYDIVFFLLLFCVISDLRTSKIKNAYVVTAIILGLAANTFLPGASGITESIKGAAVPVLSLGIFYYTGLIGAGDIKLFSSIGAVLGWKFVLYAMAYSFLACGIFALAVITRKSKLKGMFSSFFREVKLCLLTHSVSCFEDKSRRTVIRMSPAIAAGCVFQVLLRSL
jgi:prepilin peptidase CpaA